MTMTRFACVACLVVVARCFYQGDSATMSLAGLLNLIVFALGRRLDRIEARLETRGPTGEA